MSAMQEMQMNGLSGDRTLNLTLAAADDRHILPCDHHWLYIRAILEKSTLRLDGYPFGLKVQLSLKLPETGVKKPTARIPNGRHKTK
jgi:hypothetical protein